MSLNDALADSEADACTLISASRMQPLEYNENPIGVFHVNPDAVISHGEAPPIILWLRTDVNFRGASRLNLIALAIKF